MKLLIEVTRNDEFATEPEHAIVNVTKEDAQRLLKLMRKAAAIKKGTPGFWGLEVFDYTPEYFNGVGKFVDEQGVNGVTDEDIWMAVDGPVTLPDDFPDLPDANRVAVEVSTVLVQDDCIHWTAGVKHTSVVATTQCLGIDLIRKIAKGK